MSLTNVKRALRAVAAVGLVVGAIELVRRRRDVRMQRNLDVAKLGLQVGSTFASTAARKV